jgi:hypothetical protein
MEKMKIQGHVIKKTLYQGTKSEHEGLVLVTPEGEYKLRRQGGNPFWDEELAPLEGKEVSAEGLLRGNQLIMSSWNVIPPGRR